MEKLLEGVKPWHKIVFKLTIQSRPLLVKLALAQWDSKNAGVFFGWSSPNGRPWSQAFLVETVETGDKNRYDFRCMEMCLVISMRFNFGNDWNNAQCLSRSSLAKFFLPCKKSCFIFFRQNRLRFMLIWHCKVIKSQMQNRHNKAKTVNTCFL